MSMLLFARRCVLKFCLSKEWEWAHFVLHLKGDKDPVTGMILNLRIVDHTLERLAHMLEDHAEPFSTVLDLMRQSFAFLSKELCAYPVSIYELELELPHLRSRYILTQKLQVFVEMFSFLRYRELWGEAVVRLSLQEFNRLRSAEWNSSAWYLSMAESPAGALRSKFPMAQRWGFRNIHTDQWEWLESTS